MDIWELIKVIIIGIVEGITEWLPISSTGHILLFNDLLNVGFSEDFESMFNVVIQLGAIMAVVVLYFKKLWPFAKNERFFIKKDTFTLWFKIVVACIPALVIGIPFDDKIEDMFHNPPTIAITLLLYGILFIVIENRNKGVKPKITELSQITYQMAFFIGVFQMLSLIPGTSRSGATIIGAIILGSSRYIAAEFTFFLGVPVMFGASLIKVLKFGFDFTTPEIITLLAGMVTAFLVSILAIKFLIGFIKNNSFKVFGWYRIVLGIIVGGYFLITR